MIEFKNISLRKKLTIIQIVTAFIAVLICCAFFVYNDIKVLKRLSVTNRYALAEIIGINAAPSLEFIDADAAHKMLQRLKSNPVILNAVIFDKEGKVFARYDKEGQGAFPFTSDGADALKTQEGFGQKFIVSYKIADKEFLGTIKLRSEISGYRETILNYILVAVFFLIGSLLAALIISTLLQRLITQRMLSLVNTSKAVAETGNYSIRDATGGKDEIGILSAAFNNMLDQIEKTNRHLDKMNAGLEEQVELRTAELNKFQHFFNNSNDFSCIANVAGYFEVVNPNFVKVLGYSEQELYENQFLDFIHPDDIAVTVLEIEKLKTGALTLNFVNRYRKKNGDYLWFDWRSTPDPLTGKIYAIARDITEQKQAEEQLREYKYFFDNSNDISCIANTEGYFEVLNPKFEAVLGYSQNELLTNQFIDFIHPDDIPATLREYERLKGGAVTINLVNRYRKKDGDYRWFDWYATPNLLTGKIYCIARDITERKLLEDELKQFNQQLEKRVEEKTNELLKQELYFKTILDDLVEGIQIISFDWCTTYANDMLLKHARYSREEMIGAPIKQLYPGIEKTEIYRVYERCMYQRVTEEVEIEFTFPDGHMGWFNIAVQPVPEGIFILTMDISQRKKAEEKIIKYTEELKASNTELERFAYVASHDLQEPLRMVSSFMELLQLKYKDSLDEKAHTYVRYAIDGAERMKSLIHDLLLFSKVDSDKQAMEAVDCNQLVAEMQQDLVTVITENNATIKTTPLPTVTGYKTQLQQVFQNLTTNAIKYRNDKPPVIEISCKENETVWEFCVKDNAMGIDRKYFDKIFILFQRLHNNDKFSGTGIGLTVTKKIVERHGGKIWVESERGRGSSFYFTLRKKITAEGLRLGSPGGS